jgi:hypothetical protein
MTLREIAALMRRHLLAVTVVLLIAAGGGFYIGNTPPMYSESATVVFTAKNSPSGASSNASFIAPLIATEVMMAQTFLTPPAQSEVRAAGGTASFQFVPLNLYSEQYPNYDEPDATLTTTSQRPADAERTFRVVLTLLGQRLAAMQAQVRVPLRSRIQESVVGDTGLTVQPASSMRVFAGLGLLTVIAVFMVLNFLDRRQGRPGVLRPARRGRGGASPRGRPAP